MSRKCFLSRKTAFGKGEISKNGDNFRKNARTRFNKRRRDMISGRSPRWNRS